MPCEAARAAAKAEIPTITKNRTVDFTTAKGRTHYNFEDLAEIARTIDPILGKYGLSYHWRTSSTPGEPIIVTCFLTHRDGHSSDGNTLSASRDESGNKNGIQGIGSTVTYLQRYTLKAALGLSAAKDDDGVGGAGQNGGGGEADTARTAPPRYLTDAQASTLTQLLSDTKGNPDLFLRLINKPNIQAILAQDFDRMVALINNTANKRNEREAAQREAQRIAAMAEGGAV